jgi:O-antigen/teichoic acid export membrane protein
MLIGGVVDLGLGVASQRFIPEYAERKSFALLRGFLFGSRLIAVASASLVGLIGAGGVFLLEPWLEHYEIIPLYLACVTLPLFALVSVQMGIARSNNWVNLSHLPPFVIRQVFLIGLMGAAYLIGLPTTATTAMIAAVITFTVVGAGQLLLLNKRLGQTVEPGPRGYAVKTWLATSVPLFMVEGFYLLLTYSDVILLKLFKSPDEIAVYYAAAKTLALVWFIHYAVQQTTAHKFTEFHVNGDRAGLAAFFAHTIRMTFWPSLAATALLLACGIPLLWLFGPQYVSGYYLMFILAVGLLSRAAVGPAERLLNMLGHQRTCALVYATAFVTNVCLSLALIPWIGLAGAAVGTTIALIVESVGLFAAVKLRLGVHSFIWGRAPAQ